MRNIRLGVYRLDQCRQEWQALRRAKTLLWIMTKRELASRYAGSAAGVFWAYLQPLLTVAVYFLVFDIVFSMRMGGSSPTTSVGTYLVVGALPWLAFCESIARGSSSLVDAGGVLQKNALPPVLFVARSVLAGWVVFAPLMVLLALVYLTISGLSWALLAVPMLLILQGVLAFLLAYILAIFAAAVRDTLQILTFTLSVGIYLSPVFFPISMFPEEWRWLLFANPMTALIMAYHSILLEGLWPSWSLWLIVIGWLLVAAFLLNLLLGRSRDELVDWL